jgi:hypothetical protein
VDNNPVKAQQQQQQQQQQRQQQTSRGTPISLIPSLSGNTSGIVSFLIGTSSFILGLRIHSAVRTATGSTSTPSTARLDSILNKYFEILILALIIPAIFTNIFGILLVGSHLYPEDYPFLLYLFVLFIPAGAVLVLDRKLKSLSLSK